MWAKGRFSHMSESAAKAKESGFTHIEANASVPPRMVSELIETAVPISSIHSPYPMVLSSKGIPAASLSLSSLDESERIEAVIFTKKTIDIAAIVSDKAVVIHMGEVPIDLSLKDKLCRLYDERHSENKEYNRVKEELIFQRISRVLPYLDAARKSLRELSEHSQRTSIM